MTPIARDRLGRPVPAGDDRAAEPPLDPEAPRSPLQAVAAAQLLLEAGFAFAAHEVFEAQWKQRPREERDLWQGLAQVCVALTHAERGNAHGATALRARAAEHLEQETVGGLSSEYAVDVGAIIVWCRSDATEPPPPMTQGIARP